MTSVLADAGPTGAALGLVLVILLAIVVGFVALILVIVRAIRRRG
jgi:hypothetical protein